MLLYGAFLLISFAVSASSPDRQPVGAPSPLFRQIESRPVSPHSSSDSDTIVEVIVQLFNDPVNTDHIRRYASQIVLDDIASPARPSDLTAARINSFSLQNEQDRDYSNRVALRVSEMIMSDLRNKIDQRWTKKKVALATSISSLISSAIVLSITLIHKE